MKIGQYLEETFYTEKDSGEAVIEPFYLALYDKTRDNDEYSELWEMDMYDHDQMTRLGEITGFRGANQYNHHILEAMYANTEEESFYDGMTSTSIKDFILEKSSQVDFPWEEYLEELKERIQDKGGI